MCKPRMAGSSRVSGGFKPGHEASKRDGAHKRFPQGGQWTSGLWLRLQPDLDQPADGFGPGGKPLGIVVFGLHAASAAVQTHAPRLSGAPVLVGVGSPFSCDLGYWPVSTLSGLV